MSIEVNGVQYEGILFAKLPDEGYAEPTPAKETTTADANTAKEDAQSPVKKEESEGDQRWHHGGGTNWASRANELRTPQPRRNHHIRMNVSFMM